MKTINWDKCESRGTRGTYSPNTKIEHIDNVNIVPDMRIIVKYKNCEISLQIMNDVSNKKYKAKVISIKTSGNKKPNDLFVNDEVLIDHEFIYTIIS